jgi:glycerol uptake facilitator protein
MSFQFKHRWRGGLSVFGMELITDKQETNTHPTSLKYYLCDELLAKFVGTLFLLLGINSLIAQSVLSSKTAEASLTINSAIALMIIIAVYITKPISGGHLNPIVTIALTLKKIFIPDYKESKPTDSKEPQLPLLISDSEASRLDKRGRIQHILLVAIAYISFQISAACLASVIVFSMYTQSIQKFDGDSIAIASIFATYLPSNSNSDSIIYTHYLGTFLLITIIFLLSKKTDRLVFSFLIGIIPWLVSGVYLGWRTVFLLNPARDLAWGLLELCHYFNKFDSYDSRWWIPVIASLGQSFFTTMIYIVFMRVKKWCESKIHESPWIKTWMRKKGFNDDDDT